MVSRSFVAASAMSPSFRLKFDGPALEEHEIDVADLAPALVGLGQMVKSANRVVNGDSFDIAVKVRATGEGSFWIEVVVRANGTWSALRDFIVGPEVDAILKLIQIVGLAGGGAGIVGAGALSVIKRINGRQPRKVLSRGRTVTIEFDDEIIEVEEPVARVTFDPDFRAALERVAVEPLSRPGIDTVTFEGDGIEEHVTRDTAAAYLAPPVVEDGLFETLHTKVFSIIDLSFKPGKKWRLSDGHGRATLVDMEDREFLARIENSEISFTKGDLLVCQVRETARQTPKGLKADYSIIRVLDHRRGGEASRQTRMEI